MAPYTETEYRKCWSRVVDLSKQRPPLWSSEMSHTGCVFYQLPGILISILLFDLFNSNEFFINIFFTFLWLRADRVRPDEL